MLEIALRRDRLDIVELLLVAGSDPSTRIGGSELLMVVAASGQRCKAPFIRKLVAARGTPNVSDETGLTPLHLALEFGASACAEALMEDGADLQAVAVAGTTVLHSAAFGATASLVQRLIDRGVAVESRDRSGLTPLMMAAGRDPEDLERDAAIAVLLARGADPCARTPAGRTAASIASDRGALSRAEKLARACSEQTRTRPSAN
jgi:ankyrin repeat protein